MPPSFIIEQSVPARPEVFHPMSVKLRVDGSREPSFDLVKLERTWYIRDYCGDEEMGFLTGFWC